MTPQEAMLKFQELILAEDIPQWMELWTDDAVFEYPFAPPGSPTELVGKQALYENFKDFPRRLKFFEFTEVQMHPTKDPDILIIEFAGRGEAVVTGKPYHQRYISVVQMRGGKIAHYKDYWNPLVVLEAFGGSDS
jgi:ketosteroid isomerase-like protein